MLSIKDIAWVAGIIEGEGCLVVSSYMGTRPNSNKSYPIRCFRLAVEMCDLDVLLKLQHILGPCATLRERKAKSIINPKWRQRYILTLTGPELAGWLMTIYSFMGERRKSKIREGLSLWKTMRTNWHQSKQRETSLRVAAKVTNTIENEGVK